MLASGSDNIDSNAFYLWHCYPCSNFCLMRVVRDNMYVTVDFGSQGYPQAQSCWVVLSCALTVSLQQYSYLL